MKPLELSTIRIDTQDYTVTYTTNPIINTDHRECFGQICLNNKQITIKADRPPFAQYQTLLHELVHGIIHERGIEYGTSSEETAVDEIACGILGLVRDNPGLFDIS